MIFSALFSNTLSLRSSLNVRDQVSHPYTTTGKITVLYTYMFIFLDIKPEDKSFCTKWYQALRVFNEWNFDLLRLFPNIWMVPLFQRIYYLSLCCDFVLRSGLKTWPCTYFSLHLLLDQSPGPASMLIKWCHNVKGLHIKKQNILEFSITFFFICNTLYYIQ